jgi:hypothetical protein
MQRDSRNHSTNCQLDTNQLTNLPDPFNSNILTVIETSQHKHQFLSFCIMIFQKKIVKKKIKKQITKG